MDEAHRGCGSVDRIFVRDRINDGGRSLIAYKPADAQPSEKAAALTLRWRPLNRKSRLSTTIMCPPARGRLIGSALTQRFDSKEPAVLS
jgi:hypothetical protein